MGEVTEIGRSVAPTQYETGEMSEAPLEMTPVMGEESVSSLRTLLNGQNGMPQVGQAQGDDMEQAGIAVPALVVIGWRLLLIVISYAGVGSLTGWRASQYEALADHYNKKGDLQAAKANYIKAKDTYRSVKNINKANEMHVRIFLITAKEKMAAKDLPGALDIVDEAYKYLKANDGVNGMLTQIITARNVVLVEQAKSLPPEQRVEAINLLRDVVASYSIKYEIKPYRIPLGFGSINVVYAAVNASVDRGALELLANKLLEEGSGLRDAGEHERAIAFFAEAEKLAEEHHGEMSAGGFRERAQLDIFVSRIMWTANLLAHDKLDEASKIFGEIGSDSPTARNDIFNVLFEVSDSFTKTGKHAEALSAYLLAMKATPVKEGIRLVEAHRNLAHKYLAAGNVKEAELAFGATVVAARTVSADAEKDAVLEMARMQAKEGERLGDSEEAIRLLGEAEAAFDELRRSDPSLKSEYDDVEKKLKEAGIKSADRLFMGGDFAGAEMRYVGVMGLTADLEERAELYRKRAQTCESMCRRDPQLDDLREKGYVLARAQNYYLEAYRLSKDVTDLQRLVTSRIQHAVLIMQHTQDLDSAIALLEQTEGDLNFFTMGRGVDVNVLKLEILNAEVACLKRSLKTVSPGLLGRLGRRLDELSGAKGVRDDLVRQMRGDLEELARRSDNDGSKARRGSDGTEDAGDLLRRWLLAKDDGVERERFLRDVRERHPGFEASAVFGRSEFADLLKELKAPAAGERGVDHSLDPFKK